MSDDDNLRTVAQWWTNELTANFTVIPNVILRCDLGLDAYAKLILITLMSWMTKSKPEHWVRARGHISINNLHDWTGISKRKITDAIAVLEERKYIITLRSPGNSTRYAVNVVKVMEIAKYQCNIEADVWVDGPGPGDTDLSE